MKSFLGQFFILLLLALFIFLSFSTLMPLVKPSAAVPKTEFSTKRAFKHVKKIAQAPHYVGSEHHSEVRNYIVQQLQDLGLTVHTQNGYVINDFGVLSNPENIITRIKGTQSEDGEALLLLSHYDSAPYSSFGASDDASGIASILETLRAFRARGFQPKNDLIICFTDAEEIGLLGAQLFAKKHPWAKDVGLVLNFEARGSSGPSNTILETNHGNAQLIEAYANADPAFPMASSLMYEVYKMLPNDTDATVFREELDIPSFFFAFIDGHYNYHTALDTPQNLSKNSLAHQGSYLMALLPYFSNHNLEQLNTSENQVYFDFPVFKLIHYSYNWILPLLALAWLGLITIIILGFRRQLLSFSAITRGGIAFTTALILCGLIGYFGWNVTLYLYPQYLEIQQGFPYNGHLYIGAFVFIALAITLGLYHLFQQKSSSLNLSIAPLTIWVLIGSILAVAFKGASYFIIPVLCLEISCGLMIWKRHLPRLILLALTIPSIFILCPLVMLVPVALGIKLSYAALILLVLIIGLWLPLITSFSKKNWLAILATLAGIFYLWQADLTASFSEKRPKPNSLVYILNTDTQQATWKTYDGILDNWTKPFIGTKQHKAKSSVILDSKYGEQYTYTHSAPVKPIPPAEIIIQKRMQKKGDTIHYRLHIITHRPIARMSLYSAQANQMTAFSANQLPVKNVGEYSSKMSTSAAGEMQRLLTYYPIDRDTLRLRFKLPKNNHAQILLQEASLNLLHNPWLDVPQRSAAMIPRPFVLTDAIITTQVIKL